VHLYSKQIAHLFEQFAKQKNKHLPEKYWCKNRDYQQGLWDGLMDSDGCYSDRYQFNNTSQRLCELYYILTYILFGGFPNIEHRKPNAGGLENCNIENCQPSYVARLNNTHAKQRMIDFTVVKCLDRSDNLIAQKVYDLEIDDDTHSFIADNMIVHNSVCTTRVKTGFGVPQFTAIQECRRVNVFIIADGGIRTPGDAVKAFVAGADAIMLGGMLAGTDETPGETLDGFKLFRGMASKEAQEDYMGSMNDWKTAEGVEIKVKTKGPVGNVINDIMGGIRSGMTYCGANNLKQLRERADWVEVTASGYSEGLPHGAGRL